MAQERSASQPCVYMQLQPDWDETPEGESCWLDVYERTVVVQDASSLGERSEPEQEGGSTPTAVREAAHAHFQLAMDAATPRATAAAASGQEHLVEITAREKQWIQVRAKYFSPQQHRSVTSSTVFQAPTETVHPGTNALKSAVDMVSPALPKPQLHAIDVSSDEKYVAVGGADGFCVVFPAMQSTMTAETDMPRDHSLHLVGHVMDLTAVRFFPSAKVLLTGALDFTVRIWSVESGRSAAVLKGHTSGIEDIAILGKGRNVLSAGSDGLIHLWNCGTQDVIAKWGNDDHSAVHCLSVLADQELVDSEPEADEHPQEAETDGKVLFAGLDNGETLGIDIRARYAVMNLPGRAAIFSCASTAQSSGGSMLFTGSEDGLLTSWDLRNTSAPLNILSRSGSAIHDIVASNNERKSLWTAHGDGSCCNWQGTDHSSMAKTQPIVSTELTGPVYDAVRSLAVAPRTGRVFTASRDGYVRNYIPHFS